MKKINQFFETLFMTRDSKTNSHETNQEKENSRISKREIIRNNKRDTVISKAKGASESEQIKKMEAFVDESINTTESNFEKDKISNNKKRENIKKELDDNINNFEEKVDAHVEESSSKEARKVSKIDQSLDADGKVKVEITKEKDLKEIDYDEEPIVDTIKAIINKVIMVLLALTILYVGFNLNQDFFEYMIGRSDAGIVLSVILAIFDCFVAHKVGALLFEKKSKLAKYYIFSGLLLLVVIFIGQNA